MDEPAQDAVQEVEELLPVQDAPDYAEAEVLSAALLAAGVPASVGGGEPGGFQVLVGSPQVERARALLQEIRTGAHAQAPAVKVRLEAVELFRQGGRRLLSGRPEEAVDLWKRALGLYPELGDAHVALGYAYRSMQRYQEALGAFRRAAELSRDDANLWVGLGKVHGDLFQYEEARQAFRQALAVDPDDVRAHRGIGHAWLLESDFTRALEAFGKALELEPGDRRSLYCAAYVEFHRGNLRLALDYVGRALAGGSDEVDIPLLAARIHSRLGDFAQAMTFVDQAKLLAPESPDVYLALALVQADQKQWENAAAAFALAVKNGPRSLNVLAWQAWFQATCEDQRYRNPRGALEDAQRASALEPRNPELLAILAQAHFACGDRERAQGTIVKALQIVPDSPTYQELATRFQQRGKKPE
ncbi:MAG: tetratricopeptide repeat protein [Planctomycetes bacterium]|nr:tetratricopeptide repeat protein [Planctomycetota bacterium]